MVKKSMKTCLVWLMVGSLMGQTAMPVMAGIVPVKELTDIPKATEEQPLLTTTKSTPSDAEEQPENVPDSTPSDAEKDIFEKMPEIGSTTFTVWFFSHTDKAELWDWALAMIEAGAGDEQHNAFMEWYAVNEERIAAAYEKFSGIMLLDSATGDLWNDWNGDMNFAGTGTKTEPYQITSLSELMGLSEAVASGTSFVGKYFELSQSLDLGSIAINEGNWNPIGWYQNKADLSGDVTHSFKGNFDGCGNTISGLKIINTTSDLQNVGLFGVIDGGSVRNLIVEAEDIYGMDNVAVLVGAIKGSTEIHDVMISGSVYSKGDAGGIAAEITGGTKKATIENCTAAGIVLNSESITGYVGGIAGNVQKADLIDNAVSTQDGDSDRIQGKGYVGGIAGRMNLTNIYNSYVTGTIGGNKTTAAGGIVGKYESGNLILARFAGDISKTNNGAAGREGTFVGTRESKDKFTYGVEKNDNLSYLFTTNGDMAKKVFGSNIDGDNTFGKTAHIGYWTNNETKYTTVAGKTESASGDRYFYEELEAAVKYIVVLKLEKEFTSGEYAKGLSFKLDHFAPGYQGEPIKGYLVSIPRIDTRNAGGTYDTDVATLTAMPAGNSSYYRQIDKDNPAAVADGITMTVATAPKNRDGNRYQMVFDENEPGKAQPPTYIDDMEATAPMAYVSGGTYTFEMPSCDTELNVEYVKVTTKLTMDPAETTISVTHTRNGDRKSASVTTEVKNAEGILIAKYLDGVQDTTVQVQPVPIHAEQNNAGTTSDKTVKWSIDDTNLLTNASEAGYTEKDGKVIPNVSSAFIQDIITREVQAQINNNYQNKINNTIYTKSAVVTAATNPATSVDNQAVYGNCRVNVTFQIVDNTNVRVEGIVLNKSNLTYTITRRLTGDRKNPLEAITCSAPITLTATLNPAQPFFKNVSWMDEENGKIVMLEPKGSNTQDCGVMVQYDATGKNNPAWIQNVINEDNSKKEADNGYLKLSGSATKTETVTAISEDQTHGHLSAICNITINFVTVDETIIHPENIAIDRTTVNYNLTYTKKGDIKSPTAAMTGFISTKLTATVAPDIEEGAEHLPYNREVEWNSADPSVLTVNNQGIITPVKDAPWIQDAMVRAPYEATKTVRVTATAKDNGKQAESLITLTFKAYCIELDQEIMTIDLVLTKTGRRTAPVLTWTGQEPKTIHAAIHATDVLTPVYTSSDDILLTISGDGSVTPNLAAPWVQDTISKSPYKASTEVLLSAKTPDGSMVDTCRATVNVIMIDQTYSGGGSSSGGGGGGGGSTGITPSGTKKATSAPAGSVTGTWIQTADGRWTFSAGGRTYSNEWAYIHNPYAAQGQESADWFYFTETGHMMTGWYTDAMGNTYYLNPVSDNTLGRMVTGWQWIDGNCYYFKTAPDGTRGSLLKDTITPDGFKVNEQGVWSDGA